MGRHWPKHSRHGHGLQTVEERVIVQVVHLLTVGILKCLNQFVNLSKLKLCFDIGYVVSNSTWTRKIRLQYYHVKPNENKKKIVKSTTLKKLSVDSKLLRKESLSIFNISSQ